MLKQKYKKWLVTGGDGFLGRHVVARLKTLGIQPEDIFLPRSRACDLRSLENCLAAVSGMDAVVHLAAKSGGIEYSKQRQGELFYDNAVMGIHLLEAARRAEVKKFVFFGSINSYPEVTPTPFKEENLWEGYPEKSTSGYGLAKKILHVQSEVYRKQYGLNSICLIAPNLYGPGATIDPGRSHLIPSVIMKMIDAKEEGRNFINLFGSPAATRDFLYVSDAVDGLLLAFEKYDMPSPVNLGSGIETSIESVVKIIAEKLEFDVTLRWLGEEFENQPRRVLDTRKARQEFGFCAKVSLEEGIVNTVNWVRNERARRNGANL